MKLKGPGRRAMAVDFSGGRSSSDGGGLLLREADRLLSLSENLSHCFTDHRRPDLIDHSVQELVAQRVLLLTLGYEDLDDHNELSKDPLLATIVGNDDPSGQQRRQFKGQPLASSSTLGRLGRTREEATSASRYDIGATSSRQYRWGAGSPRHRVIGKAEHLSKGANPRFVVTSLRASEFEKCYVYEELYCAAQANTLRTKIFKIGALVTVSVRRIYIRLSSAFPRKELLAQALTRLSEPIFLSA